MADSASLVPEPLSVLPSRMKQWLRGLPKAELHLHLEGTIMPSTLLTLAMLPHHADHPLSAANIAEMYKFTSFSHFLSTFTKVTSYLQTISDYELVVCEMIKQLATQGILYAEVYIAFGGIYALKPDLWARVEELMTRIDDVAHQAEQEFNVKVTWIIDMTRQRGPQDALGIVQRVVDLRSTHGLKRIIGVSLGGNELAGPCRWFKEVYKLAKDNGLRCVAHAGEDAGFHGEGVQQVWEALDIGAERIGHGVAAVSDIELMTELYRLQTPIEISVTSNLCTGVVASLPKHPLRTFMARGLRVVLNSDDPAMFHSDLLAEYMLVQEELSLDCEALKLLAQSSFAASFLSAGQKEHFLGLIDEYPAL